QYSHLNQKYGGYYSQAQIKEVIAYAAQRGIEVIPEIDIPGHCRAAILSMPDLLAEPEDKSQYRSVQHYNDNVLNPGLEGTYQFIDAVLKEVAELFPSQYVHMGADEVPEGVWEQSPAAQAFMQKHQLPNTKALQGHFLRYIENKLVDLGKRMMGWEEVYHGEKISTNTIICSWTSEEAGLKCASQGFDVILQPAQYNYFDIIQSDHVDELGANWAGVTPLQKTYSYEPLASLDRQSATFKHVMGLQAGVWCELINSQQRLDFMLYPRLLAMAEVSWTDSENRNWNDFICRLNLRKPSLDAQQIEYRPWDEK
ncbi:MAG: beta-N-acetylhexosaminidase, partial [Vibrio sp.]